MPEKVSNWSFTWWCEKRKLGFCLYHFGGRLIHLDTSAEEARSNYGGKATGSLLSLPSRKNSNAKTSQPATQRPIENYEKEKEPDWHPVEVKWRQNPIPYGTWIIENALHGKRERSTLRNTQVLWVGEGDSITVLPFWAFRRRHNCRRKVGSVIVSQRRAVLKWGQCLHRHHKKESQPDFL